MRGIEGAKIQQCSRGCGCTCGRGLTVRRAAPPPLPPRPSRSPSCACRCARAAPPRAQQQLLFCVAMDLPSPGLMVLAGLFSAGSRAMRFLISAAIVMNACSTLLALLAEVSM